MIVGAGQAGTSAAFALREADRQVAITVIGEEADLPYERPPLSKHLFGEVRFRALRPEADWETAGIALRRGERCVRIDPDARTITVGPAGGAAGVPSGAQARHLGQQLIHYDYLVIATGMRPRGLGSHAPLIDPGRSAVVDPARPVRALRTVEDARGLSDSGAASVGIVGSGFLALEAARAAGDAGLESTLYLRGRLPLEGRVSPVLAEHLFRVHAEAGVVLVPQAGLDLPDDPRLATHDAVIAAVGGRASGDLLLDAGLDVSVDAHLRCADARIFAIGDVALAPAWNSPGRARDEAENTARLHGEYLGATLARVLAGEDVDSLPEYSAVPWNWSFQGPVRVFLAGGFRRPPAVPGPSKRPQAASGPQAPEQPEYDPHAGIEDVVLGEPASGSFVVLRFQAGELRVVETVGAPGPHAQARKILASGTLPTPEQARAPGFTLRAFGRTVV